MVLAEGGYVAPWTSGHFLGGFVKSVVPGIYMRTKAAYVSERILNLVGLALLVYICLLMWEQHIALNRMRSQNPPQTVTIKDVDWHRSHHTLVFGLETGCHFCAESASFYRALLTHQQLAHWQAVAVFPEPSDQARAYMQSKGYLISEVRQMDLGEIGVFGTPTLLLVDQSGKVVKRWIGKLTGSQEDDVALALGVPPSDTMTTGSSQTDTAVK